MRKGTDDVMLSPQNNVWRAPSDDCVQVVYKKKTDSVVSSTSLRPTVMYCARLFPCLFCFITVNTISFSFSSFGCIIIIEILGIGGWVVVVLLLLSFCC